ncbi:MAG TPA: xylulokinase [Chloroflexota bacterium]|nr:xylulokinase [Chloroflexota bacterium]
MERPPLLLGIDLGTSAVKAIVVSPEGGVVGEASWPLVLSSPRTNWSEQNPEDWWAAVVAAVQALGHRNPALLDRVVGLAVSGQMHGATFVDAHGKSLRPAILWNDGRSEPQCQDIEGRLGRSALLAAVGNPALPGFTAPKILWLRLHECETFLRTRTVLLPKDYINFRLTGVSVTEPSDASGTLLFDVVNRTWSEPVLAALDLDPSLLPPVVASDSVIGCLRPEVAEVLGLPDSTVVVAGGADNACAAIAVGAVDEGVRVVSIGTSGTVLAPSAEPRIDAQARLHSFCHAVPDRWYVMGVTLSAGASLRWYRDIIGAWATADGDHAYDLITAEADTVSAGSDGLIFLPYLTGERTPHADAWARAVFFGLSIRHTRAHLSRAVLEGITFALKDSADLIDELGIGAETVTATGGGAHSAFWLQLLADVFQVPMAASLADLGPAFGAAILAGVGAGVFDSVKSAALDLAAIGGRTTPDPELRLEYARAHARFRDLYPALRSQFRSLA